MIKKFVKTIWEKDKYHIEITKNHKKDILVTLFQKKNTKKDFRKKHGTNNIYVI